MEHAPSDSDLLATIACKGDVPEEADISLSTFIIRHGQYLFDWLSHVYSKHLGHDEIEDIYQMTIVRVWDRAETYDDRKEGVRPWLCSIAKNLVADFFRSIKGKETTINADIWEILSQKAERDVSSAEDLVIDALSEGLNKLTEREREILLATAHFYVLDVSAKDQRMPRDVLAQLADRWNTTATNLRKIRQRALEKLRSHLLESGITSETVKNFRGGRNV